MSENNVDLDDTFTIHISNDVEMTAFARMVIRRVLPPLDTQQEPMFYGAFTEIVTNAIEEHGRRGAQSDVDIGVSLEPAIITVSDRGGGFDPDFPPASPDGNSGLGLVITRSVVPDVRFESGPSGTSVFLPYPESGS